MSFYSQVTRVRYAFGNLASTIHQSLVAGAGGGLRDRRDGRRIRRQARGAYERQVLTLVNLSATETTLRTPQKCFR
jgi:hypothetical protein